MIVHSIVNLGLLQNRKRGFKMGLARFGEYTRKQIHDYFDPESPFLAQTGTWGLHGIVRVPRTESDWVFFVTFGQRRGSFVFEEAITNAGVLSWQSQPRQTLSDRAVRSRIGHDANRHHIYLFLRVRRSGPYLYMGELAYVGHDPHRERPVFFKWQIRDWSPPDPILKLLNLPPAAPRTPGDGVPSVHERAIALVTQRHVFVQWLSPDGKPQGGPDRFPNSIPGLRRLLRVAPGASLALMWTDAARLKWGAWADDHPGTLTYLPWNDTASALTRAPSSALHTVVPDALAALLVTHQPADPPPLPASQVDRAVRLSQRWMRDARKVREAEQHIKALLSQVFPGFATVCRDWRSKSALWILEHYPTPAEVLRTDVTVLVEGVSLATARRVGLAKVERLRTAARAAASVADPSASGPNLVSAIQVWKRRKGALATTEAIQSFLGATGKFPPSVRRTARPRRTPMAPEKRPGGRYYVTTTAMPSVQPARSTLECQRYSTGWRLLLRAAGAKAVRQQGRYLTRVGDSWILESAHPVDVDDETLDLPLHQPMIFRLAKQQDQSLAPLVSRLSHRHQHLLVAPEGVTVSGGQPQQLFPLDGWHAFLIPETGAVRVTTTAGQLFLERSAVPDYHLTLTGTQAGGIDGSPPLFLGAFPAVEGDTSEPLTLVVGQDGQGLRRWRQRASFLGGRVDLPLPPSSMEMGWYFLRVYDGRQTELETHEFFWIHNLVSIESSHTPSGVAELRFRTAGPLSISTNAALPLATTAANLVVAEIPLHPQFDVTRWSFRGTGPRDEVRNVGIRVARTAWALGDEGAPAQDLVWTTTPIDLPLAAALPTSRQVLYLSVSRTDGLPKRVTLSCGHSQRTVSLTSGRGLFPVRNLATAIPLDARDVSQPISVTLTIREDNRSTPEVLALARLVPQYRCGKCGAAFRDDHTGLVRHVKEEHPIQFYEPKEYDAYLALARSAKMVPNLPHRVYVCGLCSMVVRAERSAYANPTSVMSEHWRDTHERHRPGESMTLSILHTVEQVQSVANLILTPLGQCLECRDVISLDGTAAAQHGDLHHTQWVLID